MKKLPTFTPIKNLSLSLPRVAREISHEVEEGQLFMVAASLTYMTLLSIIPLLAVSFAIFEAFGGLKKLYGIIEPLILSNFTESTGEEAITKIHEFINNAHAGVVGIGGLIGLIFTSMSMLYNFEKAINHVWKVRVTRGFFQRIMSYWFFVTLGPIAASVIVGVATSFSLPISRFFPSGTGFFMIVVTFFTLIYKWVPQTKVKWSSAFPSAVVAAFLWNLARVGYSYYTRHIVSYHKVYGSLGAIPVLMLWINIEWIILLMGAALSAALQKKAKN